MTTRKSAPPVATSVDDNDTDEMFQHIAKELTGNVNSKDNIPEELKGVSHRLTAVLKERDEADANLFTSLVNLIDVVLQRGAIHGDELISTGVLRENLIKRLKETETFQYRS